jgi:predicted nucleic acid-binding protein
VVPAHFEADAYAGIRRLVSTKALGRDAAALPMSQIAELPGERIALAPLVPGGLRLYDNVGAHDSFYVVLALLRSASLLTSDRPLARIAQQLGVTVLFRPAEVIG